MSRTETTARPAPGAGARVEPLLAPGPMVRLKCLISSVSPSREGSRRRRGGLPAVIVSPRLFFERERTNHHAERGDHGAQHIMSARVCCCSCTQRRVHWPVKAWPALAHACLVVLNGCPRRELSFVEGVGYRQGGESPPVSGLQRCCANLEFKPVLTKVQAARDRELVFVSVVYTQPPCSFPLYLPSFLPAVGCVDSSHAMYMHTIPITYVVIWVSYALVCMSRAVLMCVVFCLCRPTVSLLSRRGVHPPPRAPVQGETDRDSLVKLVARFRYHRNHLFFINRFFFFYKM